MTYCLNITRFIFFKSLITKANAEPNIYKHRLMWYYCSMLVQPVHEQIALDAYWEGPVIPEALSLSLGTRTLNLFFSEGSLQAIDTIYRRADRAGDTQVATIEPGEPFRAENTQFRRQNS